MNREVDILMTMQGPTITPEVAARILETGALKAGGKELYVFLNERLSELPQLKIEEVMDTDIVVFTVKGSINGPHGPSFVCEVGATPKIATHTLLLNETGVMGKQIAKVVSAKRLPLWAHICERHPENGNSYYSFDPPVALTGVVPQRVERIDSLDDLPL